MTALVIESDGPAIRATNFWQTAQARAGAFYLSINAGAFRLLVPSQHMGVIAEFETAKEVIVSRGPWSQAGGKDSIELLFDEWSDNPFSLHLGPGQFDRLQPARDAGRTCPFTAWALRGGVPAQVYRHDCRYRIVLSLPWLKPW